MLAGSARLPADEVFLDLEDSVAAEAKTDDTRAKVVRALHENKWLAKTVAVRVNSVDTEWCFQDLIYVVTKAGARLDCVMIPKVEAASHIHFVAHLLDQLESAAGLDRKIGLEAQIETARGLVNVESIAASSRRLEALIFGPGDYAASIGAPQLSVGAIEGGYPGDQWHYPLSRIIVTARSFGLQAIDGPYSMIHDAPGFRESALRSRLLGYDGKWAIHPSQIDVCNEIYMPSKEQFERAGRILEAYRHATSTDHTGAVMFDGEMIDEASRKMAESVAAQGRAAGLALDQGD
jgi:citrate lyase subunit beta/citryl-CoA lyase